MSKSISITILNNGPMRISSDKITVNYCGEAVAVEEDDDVYICRCGESQKAPFCDGRHSKTDFNGASEEGPKKELRVWEGKNIRTFFNPKTCMHVFYCKPLKELRQRELEGDEEAAAEIAKVVRSCPSGALSYEAKNVPKPAPISGPDIDIIEGGEVRVQCDFEINTELGERQYTDRATLCRCGLSTNKPWCDGRHKKRPDFR